MEKDVEERLRSKFALIDRTDPGAIQAAQQVKYILTLKTPSEFAGDNILIFFFFFLIFQRKLDLTFHVNRLLCRRFT